MARDRIDSVLARRGLAESREKAKILIMAGAVYVDGERVSRPDRKIDQDAGVEIRTGALPYVGYGGVKLAHAAQAVGLDVRGKTAMDIGSSTGGFVDCLLQAGAKRVWAIDVGTHQLHERLRRDARVIVRENVNARYLRFEDIGEQVDVVTVDVSFISLKKILPVLVRFLKDEGTLLTLVKPQFEAGRYQVGKGGIVKDDERINHILEDMKEFGRSIGLKAREIVEAPRDKEKKNREFFILWEK